MDSITIPNIIIKYIGDSLKWIHTVWNGEKVQEGISYYGYSFIEGDEIDRFKNIIKQWKNLFFLAPNEFILTGNYLLDEEQYEKSLVSKNELMEVFDSCVNMCEKALAGGYKILHNGI